MISLLRDKLAVWSLEARSRRLLLERSVRLAEGEPVAEDPGRWTELGQHGRGLTTSAQEDLRTRVRGYVRSNAYAANLLRLLEIYVVGPGLGLGHSGDEGAAAAGDAWWSEFMEANASHFSPREFARRVWRDGECFLRLFAQPAAEAPQVRFVDPEFVSGGAQHPDSQGLLTDPDDVETVTAYLRIGGTGGDVVEEIDPREVLHCKRGVDSNEKRGLSIFAPLVDLFANFDGWLDSECKARKMQASIVLWRKVSGSTATAATFADAAADSASTSRRETIRAGTILTTSPGTSLEFLQPDTNFADSGPLGRMLLLQMAAGGGVAEYALTSDAANANFSSTLVAEAPMVKHFASEQEFMTAQLARVWRWVMADGIRQGRLPAGFFELVSLEWSLPELVVRDREKARSADVRLVESQILSRAEIRRRDGVDPVVMADEIAAEAALYGSPAEPAGSGMDDGSDETAGGAGQ